MANSSATLKNRYDFDRFEGASNEEKDSRKPKLLRRTIDPAKRGSLGKAVVSAVVAVGLLSLPLLSEAQITELSGQIADKEIILDELRSENVRLMTDIESKSAIKSVQSYAEEVLGMQKLDKSQIEYVSTEGGSQIIIPDYEPGFFTVLYNNFLDFVDYISG
jgi:hypothetical protein